LRNAVSNLDSLHGVLGRRCGPALPCLCSAKNAGRGRVAAHIKYDTRLRFSLSPLGERVRVRGRSSDCPDPLTRGSVSHAKSDCIRPQKFIRFNYAANLANPRPACLSLNSILTKFSQIAADSTKFRLRALEHLSDKSGHPIHLSPFNPFNLRRVDPVRCSKLTLRTLARLRAPTRTLKF